MRKPAAQSNSVSYVANNFNMIAPISGWNVIDSLANMSEKYALYMDNFWPKPTSVELRKGWIEFASVPEDVPAVQAHDVRGLLSYSSPTGTKELFACDQTGIYNITAGGAIPTADTPSTNGSWRSVNISNAGGNFLWACNGVDEARYYDGTNWVLLNTLSTPSLTGVTSTDIINLCVFKSRLYIVAKNSLDFYYLGVNSVSGAATAFPLGAVFSRGGSLITIETWSLDSGEGIDDYIVFITSEGEVAVYQGFDPGVAANWALVGTYYVGEPLSHSCAAKVGGDLLILTVQGVYPLSKALQFSTTNKQIATSYNIQSAFDFYVENGASYYGWQILFFPAATMLIVNVPFKRDDANNFLYSYQFAMNTTHNAWTRMVNMASEVWVVHDNELYFAKHHEIFKAWTGTTDGTQPIRGKVKQAFSRLGNNRYNKHVKLVKPIIETNGDMGLQLGFDTDFKTDVLVSSQSTFAQAISRWDEAIWDKSVWTGIAIESAWRTVPNDTGMWFSLNLSIETKKSDISWISTQYSTISGGYI